MINNHNVLDGWLVEYHSGIPVYRQIINQVCAAVASDSFKPGDQLPTIRSLSGRLNVNPNTVAKAYRELELKGIIISERGTGSFICENGAGSLAEGQPPAPATPPAAPATDNSAKQTRLKNLYQQLLADMAGSGLTKSEMLSYIQEHNP